MEASSMAASCSSFCEFMPNWVGQQCQLGATWLPDDLKETIKSVAIGIIVGLGAFIAVASVFYLLETHCSWFSTSQDAIKIFHVFKNVHPLLDVAWRALWRGYIVLLGPAIEELLFRGCLNHGIKKCFGEEDSLVKKIVRVALVALIFGACHLSPFQNAISNAIIFGATASIGLVFGIVREYRKDLVSSTAAHIAYNLAATL